MFENKEQKKIYSLMFLGDEGFIFFKKAKKLIIYFFTRVGKTSLKKRIFYNTFEEEEQPTVLTDFSLVVSEEANACFQVWDCPGFKELFILTSVAVKNLDLLVLVFDVGISKTFINIERWLKIAYEEFEDLNKYKIPVICVGNKVDNQLDKHALNLSSILKWCDSKKIDFFDVSAKTPTNIEKLKSKIISTLQANEIKKPNIFYLLEKRTLENDSKPRKKFDNFFCC